MWIGLELDGEGAEVDAIADAIAARADDPAPLVERLDERTRVVTLHPGAEPLELTAEDRGVRLRASTGAAGPGYHRHVLALAEALDVAWAPGGDSTGWREARDPEALEEVYLDWLGATAAQILELASGGASGFSLAMPAGVAYEHDEVVATQLGPRSFAWLEATRADARAGIDVFPWWGEARDAAYYRGLALVELWRTIRWRPPITEEERAVMDRVATWIERAHGLDPALSLPWAEQSELLTLLDEASLRATRAHLKAQSIGPARIGYRRRAVHVELSGGWSLTIGGELAERWDERGTWVAWDEGRSVFFNSFSARGDGPPPSSEETLHGMPPLDGDELFELERGALRGIAALSETEEDGAPLYRLEAHAAHGPHAAVGTLVFRDAGDREWALATWGSLRRR
ncbi:MAG: hypothetical protein KF729_10125 [Sandaracinaceae bacterium]|nr:hypothetical protein [Sandaracinaceae bacterium]